MTNNWNLTPLQPNCFRECPAFPSCTKYFKRNLKAQKWNSKLTLIPRVRIILCKSQLTAGLIPNNLGFYTIKEPLSWAHHKIRCCIGQRLRKPTSISRIYTNKSINSEEEKEEGCTLQVSVAVGLKQTINCLCLWFDEPWWDPWAVWASKNRARAAILGQFSNFGTVQLGQHCVHYCLKNTS